MGTFAQIKDAMVFAFNLPAIVELGTATGFDFQLIDQGGLGHEKLTQARNQLFGEVRNILTCWSACVQRSGRYAAVQNRYRSGESAGAGRFHQRHQYHAGRSLGR
jgi:multidrug efflux pump subunit AcrB